MRFHFRHAATFLTMAAWFSGLGAVHAQDDSRGEEGRPPAVRAGVRPNARTPRSAPERTEGMPAWLM